MRRLLQHAKGGLDVKITGASTSTAAHYYCKLSSTSVVVVVMGEFITLLIQNISPKERIDVESIELIHLLFELNRSAFRLFGYVSPMITDS